MSRDKQIEEMAFDLCRIDTCKHLPQAECDKTTCAHCEAEALYNAGYRKASEIVGEIIKDLVNFADDNKKQMLINGHSIWFINADDVTEFIAELKKKFTEEMK